MDPKQPKYNSWYKVHTMVQTSDIIITVHNGKISIAKNRDGESGNIDIPELLEILMSYQNEAMQPFIREFINKWKTYRLFS